MVIRWSRKASDDLEQICDYIANDSMEAATRTAQTLLTAIDRLKDHPEMGRPAVRHGKRLARSRELISRPYIISYRIDKAKDTILLDSIVHSERYRDQP
jgi:addiction module RelE/StbE family toxin